tara:strand:- start:4767 stop:5777 length:1011 start_codon:yes stop_codon:yes gene_type:complete
MENLVISGGGIYGYYGFGIIKYLEEKSYLQSINNFYGTSIGSFICLLILLGYNSLELERTIIKYDISKTVDIDILNLFNNYGISNNIKFKRLVSIFIRIKVKETDITFRRLYEIYNKELNVIATNLETCKETIFNYKNTPDILLVDAITASCSVPFIFQPVKIENILYVDGLLCNNFPCNLVKNNGKTIGVMLGLIGDNPFAEKKIDSIYDYIYRIFQTIVIKSHNEVEILIKYENEIDVELDPSFNISYENKLKLIEYGYNNCKNVIKEYEEKEELEKIELNKKKQEEELKQIKIKEEKKQKKRIELQSQLKNLEEKKNEIENILLMCKEELDSM